MAEDAKETSHTVKKAIEDKAKSLPKCGIIMPISEMDGCSEAHWRDMLTIFKDAAKEAGFESDIVSNSNEIGIIQDSIVTNIYENEIVICDVSCKNPNVMFELGMRLAFDKPTIIVKDDFTNYSFDTSPIRHVEYPRDLHHFKLMAFRNDLIQKIKATYQASRAASAYSPFLKHFGKFRVAKIETHEVSSQEYIIKTIDEISEKIEKIRKPRIHLPNSVIAPLSYSNKTSVTKISGEVDSFDIRQASKIIDKSFLGKITVSFDQEKPDELLIYYDIKENMKNFLDLFLKSDAGKEFIDF